MNCSAGRKKLCMQSGSNGRSGLGLDRGLAPQKLTFLWQLYMGGRSGEGGRKDGRFWQKTRTKKAECSTSTNSAPQALILDRGRLWSPDPSPQHCPESAGASRALESLYHATGNDRRNLAQIKVCHSTVNNPELHLTAWKCPRQQALIFFCPCHFHRRQSQPVTNCSQLSSPNVSCLVTNCRAAPLTQPGINNSVGQHWGNPF